MHSLLGVPSAEGKERKEYFHSFIHSYIGSRLSSVLVYVNGWMDGS